MTVCGTRDCKNEAIYNVFWPGQFIQLCDHCTKHAQGIAEGMGFLLTVLPIVKESNK